MPRSRQTCSRHLAWAGWAARVPDRWRPLRIEGGWERGAIIVGDENAAILQIKWWRPESRRFDAAAWLARRLRKLSGRPAPPGDVPAPDGFDPTALLLDYAPKGGGLASLWYGCAPAAGVVLEAVVSRAASKKDQRTALRRVLPALRLARPGDPVRWAIFGASFESPPGFAVRSRRVHLGDVALLLAAGTRARLMLRQVYPADLALARRELAHWLVFPVFKEHRRFRAARPDEPWSVESFGRRLEGVRRAGWKRLPWPLGRCAARRSTAAVVHDGDLGRLLLAEYDSAGDPAESVLAGAIGSMNWAELGGDG